jgi:hypothetical protein
MRIEGVSEVTLRSVVPTLGFLLAAVSRAFIVSGVGLGYTREVLSSQSKNPA